MIHKLVPEYTTDIMNTFIFVSFLLPVFFSSLNAEDEDLFQVLKRQHPIGMPCRGYEFICNTLSTAVCCHGYCHYTCYDEEENRKPRPQWPTRPPPTTSEPTTLAPTTTEPAQRPGYMPTPEPCVVKCSEDNLKTSLPPDTATACTLNFQSASITPTPYNATHSAIRHSYEICCPASFAG